MFSDHSIRTTTTATAIIINIYANAYHHRNLITYTSLDLTSEMTLSVGFENENGTLKMSVPKNSYETNADQKKKWNTFEMCAHCEHKTVTATATAKTEQIKIFNKLEMSTVRNVIESEMMRSRHHYRNIAISVSPNSFKLTPGQKYFGFIVWHCRCRVNSISTSNWSYHLSSWKLDKDANLMITILILGCYAFTKSKQLFF